MQTYILALSKYFITGSFALYTLFAFLSIKKEKGTQHRRAKWMDGVEIGLILFFHVLSYITLFAATESKRYLFLLFVQSVVFLSAILLFQTLYHNCNRQLFLNMCILMDLGLVIITRISFEKAVKQFAIITVGLVISLIIPFAMKKFRHLKNLTYIYALVGALLLGVVLLLGVTTQGSKITYTILGITLQPSEFVKLIFVFFLASAFYEASDFKEVMITGVIAAAHVLILVASKDLGSALIFFIVYSFVVFLATGKAWYLLLFGALGAAGAVVGTKLFTHVQVRVQAFLDPFSVIDSMGYQITQSLFSISSGGAFGLGLTQGTPDKIPYVESDFIFAAIAEEMGLIIGVCLILLCLNCFIIMLRISVNFADRFYRLIAYGMAVAYIFQTFLTIGGETKFIPLTGVTLPLVSYGGSSVLATLIMFSIVEALAIIQQDRLEEFRARFEAEHERYPAPARRRATSVRSDARKPSTMRHTDVRTHTSKPAASRPTTRKPTSRRPVESRPSTNRPVNSRPVESRPNTNRPMNNRPLESRPNQSRSNTNRPVSSRPVESRPNTNRPVNSRPVESGPNQSRTNLNRPYVEKPSSSTRQEANDVLDWDADIEEIDLSDFKEVTFTPEDD